MIIAHRALIDGPNPELENTPAAVEAALAMGFDVEIDVWWKDGWFLGHDKPTYPVSKSFLTRHGLWLHLKNPEALSHVTNGFHYFWHEEDTYTLTSQGFVWAYPGSEMVANMVEVLPERMISDNILKSEEMILLASRFGPDDFVCTKYGNALRFMS